MLKIKMHGSPPLTPRTMRGCGPTDCVVVMQMISWLAEVGEIPVQKIQEWNVGDDWNKAERSLRAMAEAGFISIYDDVTGESEYNAKTCTDATN